MNAILTNVTAHSIPLLYYGLGFVAGTAWALLIAIVLTSCCIVVSLTCVCWCCYAYTSNNNNIVATAKHDHAD